MLTRYVLADLIRNPRRTLSTMIGVTLGVGLFCGVLFFVDGLSASMTQRAVEPLAIDMQRIVTDRFGGSIELTQTFDRDGVLAMGDRATVELEISNGGEVAVNELTLRSVPGPGLTYVVGSAQRDGRNMAGFDDNPFDHGPGQTGFNLGSIDPGTTELISYQVEAESDTDLSDSTVMSSYSSREAVNPVGANQPAFVPLDELAGEIAAIDGVDHATPLSLADLGSDKLEVGGVTAIGPTKIFGFDEEYASRDFAIEVVGGAFDSEGAVLSAEAAEAMGAELGDTVTALLPDDSRLELPVAGIADLSRARSLFSSRRGGDLETFVYSRNSIVVSASTFAERVQPAFARAASARGSRLKSPPIREIDIGLDRALLAADPATALVETERLAAAATSVAEHQDYMLDNISNTLSVAAADARVAKRLFVFLGVPGALLAAMLSAYAGTVLADAQRREQATLRIRGASRRHLLRLLGLRTALLTGVGAIVGLMAGYIAAAAILGRESLNRASTASLITSALLGTLAGFCATGLALYVTGRRSIDREIDEDRARLSLRRPLWRRARLDVVGVAIVLIGTLIALRAHAFDGTAGSVYFGRSVELNLALLVLPVAVWVAGSLLAARLFGTLMEWRQPASSGSLGRPLPSLYRLSIGRRPWAISNAAVIVSLIVALATSLGVFTASYDTAKVDDARYATGADIRITPSPTAQMTYGVDDTATFETSGVVGVTPVIYGLSNVIARSDRTSDPINLAAIDPDGFVSVAPVQDDQVPSGDVRAALGALGEDPNAVLLSNDMAGFLQTQPGDTINVLLSRATEDQVEVELRIAGVFERMPGFPEGADALMSIDTHTAAVPNKSPDFFLARIEHGGDAALESAVDSLRQGPGSVDDLQIDTRASTLASDQSSLAALNIAGLVDLDSTFALSMAIVAIVIFVFGLLLQRRREYITLRAQGLESRSIRLLIAAEAATVALGGVVAGLFVGTAMGFYFVAVLRPLFVLPPPYILEPSALATPVVLILMATLASSLVASRLVSNLEPTELLRDE